MKKTCLWPGCRGDGDVLVTGMVAGAEEPVLELLGYLCTVHAEALAEEELAT